MDVYSLENEVKELSFEKIDFKIGETIEFSMENNKFIFLLNGKLKILFYHMFKEMPSSNIFMAPSGYFFSVTAMDNSSCIIISFPSNLQLHNCFSNFELKDNQTSYTDYSFLPFNKAIDRYLDGILNIINDKISSPALFKMKIEELCFYFTHYYSKNELYLFFKYHLLTDLSFSEQVLKNYKKAKTVQELSSMLNFSLSGFQKHFKKVFGISPCVWMQRRLIQDVVLELSSNQLTIKEIALKYSFSSTAHFSSYCKRKIGAPPSRIISGDFVPEIKNI